MLNKQADYGLDNFMSPVMLRRTFFVRGSRLSVVLDPLFRVFQTATTMKLAGKFPLSMSLCYTLVLSYT